MNLRSFLEAITIGPINSELSTSNLEVVTIMGLIFTAIQFFVALSYNYEKEEWTRSLKLHTNLIVCLPLLFLACSLEFLVFMQFAFNINLFTLIGISFCIYMCIKFIAFVSEESFCILTLTSHVQALGTTLTNKEHPYLFQGTIDYYKSLYYVHKQQSNYLK